MRQESAKEQEREVSMAVKVIERCELTLAAMSARDYAVLARRATTALVALLRALDLPPRSEVLMPVTMCANPANAVRWAGLRPLFADISPVTLNMDLEAAERVVGPWTSVLLAVPLFGHPLDVPALLDFAGRHDLIVIEDAAQAVGLAYESRRAGSIGLCSVYSFGAGKIGDAGGGAALLSDDAGLMRRARAELTKMPGGAYDMTRQAGRILDALGGLPGELEARGEMARRYREALQMPRIAHPDIPPGAPLWKYSVLLPNLDERDRVTRELLSRGVQATNLYPPLMRFVADFTNPMNSARLRFPNAWDVGGRIVNLPLWPQPPGLLERVVGAFTA
jgi:dTDP-4-amino-4,6-dideoxygalactose transaminase